MTNNKGKTKLAEERKELNERIEALDEFLASPEKRASISAEEQELLNKQLLAMCEYLDVLDKRIALEK